MTDLLDLHRDPRRDQSDRGSNLLSPPSLNTSELEAMDRLRALLDERSWPHLYLHIGRGEPFADDFARAVARVDELEAAPRRLLRLFGLGLPAVEHGASTEERLLINALVAAGLARRDSGSVRTCGWVVAPALGGEVIMGLPATYARQPLAGALGYLGNDSLLLAKLLGPCAGRRVLDLGAGCGAQGLLAARGAAGAVLTDIDPFSLRVSALNWALNKVAHPVLFAEGDLFDPVAGEQFDTVVVLPPYVPTLAESGVSVTAAGGADGLSFLRRLLAGITSVLSPGGELVALAQLLCDDEAPLLARELAQLVPELDVQLVLIDRHPLQPYVGELAARLSAHAATASPKALAASLEEELRAKGATGICTAAIRARRTAGRAAFYIVGPTGHLVASDVLSLAPGVVVADSIATHALTSSRGGQALDPVTATLVGALDGQRNVVEAAATVWGHPAGAQPCQLAEQALHRLGQLAANGLVVANRR